jgi:predicted acylesterase/phospholipase RssA
MAQSSKINNSIIDNIATDIESNTGTNTDTSVIDNDTNTCAIDNNVKDTNTDTNTDIIKHLVFSGGGPAGLLTYGAAKYLSKEGFWNLSNIESIYGCSIGAYMGVIISLNYEWDWLDDYFIKRPWNKVVGLDAISFIEAFDNKGLLGDTFIVESLKPLLEAKDLSTTITLQELYDYNHIDIHIYTTNLNTSLLDKVDISHTTHPTMSVIKALYMTSAYPFAFKPICEEGECFIDGGLLNNYPLNDCISQTKCNKNEILAFKNVWIVDDYKINNQSSVIDFLIVLMKKMQKHIDTEGDQEDIKNTVRCLVEDLDSISSWIKALSTPEMRKQLIEKGSIQAKLFYEYSKTFNGNC